MKDVLLYHIVPGKLGRDNFRPGAEYTTLLPYPSAADGANGRNETVRSGSGWVHLGSSPAALPSFERRAFAPEPRHSPVPVAPVGIGHVDPFRPVHASTSGRC